MNDRINFTVSSIGVIRSPHMEMKGTPVQPCWAAGIKGTIELYPEYVPGLKDIEGFSHIIVLYMFDRILDDVRLTPTPFLDSEPHGVFATRSPWRPNHIGISVLRLVSIKKNIIEVDGVDMLDMTPLIDIKPYVPEFDPSGEIRTGWFRGKCEAADGRVK